MTKNRTPTSTVGISSSAVNFGCMFGFFNFGGDVSVGWLGGFVF